ncbi:hypothetical protein NKH85_04940 [Mesorhizobium sp. M0924]|uniref:hypothetical protein n=1 Tax=unclassified Mesorhizobium TaxID=325217 RepID=UPI00333BE69C
MRLISLFGMTLLLALSTLAIGADMPQYDTPTSRSKTFPIPDPFWTFDGDNYRASNISQLQVTLFESVDSRGHIVTSYKVNYMIYNNTWGYPPHGWRQHLIISFRNAAHAPLPTTFEIEVGLPRGACTPHHSVPSSSEGYLPDDLSNNLFDQAQEMVIAWNRPSKIGGAC